MSPTRPPSNKPRPPAGPPSPSASVLLISPTNQILLLHRVRHSSAFASAHVFPGGNLDARHDGDIPGVDDPARHEDGPAYRMGAVRETFEESGILLALNKEGGGGLVRVEEQEREEGRKLVHGGKARFGEWVRGVGGVPDVDGLIPFTRWVTPTNVPKRFTTQMYLYFLPLALEHPPPSSTSTSTSSTATTTTPPALPTTHEALIPTPTSDGGIEHTAARFLPASTWLAQADAGDIILFPPQYFLLSMIAPFLSPRAVPNVLDAAELARQRELLRDFLKTGDPVWADKCISPTQVMRLKGDGRAVLGLDKPGPELQGSGRRGERERVVLVDFGKDGPRRVEVRWREDVFEGERGGEKL